MSLAEIKNKGLRKSVLPKVLILKIHRPNLHLSSLGGAKATPNQSAIVRPVGIDTIQVALPTVIVPPGSSNWILCGAVH